MRTLIHAAVSLMILAASPAAALANPEEDLLQAASSGQVSAVQKLLDAGASVNAPDLRGTTPLMAASYGGHSAVVQLLLDYGASTTEPDLTGNTALSLAHKHKHRKLVYLLEAQTGFAYGFSKLNHKPGRHRLGGGVLEIRAQKSGAMVLVFTKYSMTYEEANMIARVLGGPGLDYGSRLFGPGYITYPAVGNNHDMVHVDAKVLTWSGTWANQVVVTLK